MVVPKDDGIEAWHLASHLFRSVLRVTVGSDASIDAGMEYTDNDVRLLFFLHVGNPLTGRGLDVNKLQFAPQFARKPVGDGRSEHADESNLHTVALNDFIRRNEIMVCTLYHNVGAQDREVSIEDVALVSGAAGFYFVVAKGADFAAHVVEHLVCEVDVRYGNGVIVIRCGLPLNDVAVIDIDEAVAPRGTLLAQIALHPRQAASGWTVGYKIVRIEIGVNVRCADDAEFHFLRPAGCEGKQSRKNRSGQVKNSFFHNDLYGVFGLSVQIYENNPYLCPQKKKVFK